MKTITILGLLFLLIQIEGKPQLPVKFDNHYKTIFAKDLCKLAATNRDLILIDVRSPGEYSDTSAYNYLNIGHLKSSINIPIDSIQKNLAVLEPYKNKTIVFYCSHSQRSRRVSYLLSQNGYKDFYNLNGGMSLLNQMTEEEFPCKAEYLQSNLKYRNISSIEAIEFIQKNPSLAIIDVRAASMFENRDTLAYYNIGRVKGAINIPYKELSQRIDQIEKYKNQPILVYANAGNNDAGKFASELQNRGFKQVLLLVGGYDDLLVRDNAQRLLEQTPGYRILNGPGTLLLLKKNPQITIYDTRPKIEFENKMTAQEFYRNLGHIKNAIHLEGKDFGSYNFPRDKTIPILIYGRDEAYKLAQQLSEAGYRNVNLLRNLYDFIASAFNVEGNKESLSYMTDHEGLY